MCPMSSPDEQVPWYEKRGMPLAVETYDLDNPRHLLDFLIYANIRLVKFEHLKKLCAEGMLWPRREDVKDALVSLQDLKHLNPEMYWPSGFHHFSRVGSQGERRFIHIVSLSHSWESCEHADPWGWQLHRLVDAIEAFEQEVAQDRYRGLGRRHRELFHDDVVEYWVFIDFVCLPQYKRKLLEDEFFQRAMDSMHLLYAHAYLTRVFRIEELTPADWKRKQPTSIRVYCEKTDQVERRPLKDLTVNSTPYCQRGWCIAESQWMSTRRHVALS